MNDKDFSPINHWTCKFLVYDLDSRSYKCSLKDIIISRSDVHRPTSCKQHKFG